ncbi:MULTISPECIES: aspartate/glutamate racemase family protein [unclassified Granulicatella]|uniref:aspartate/glutamate racemase family protein n=1 Tax=unclassified Granulicatella TaxID=2630493 RepID=UPI001073E791|nr:MULTISPECIES: aspartate/glutamate racemase family protein [unclassified Granulicatella]MBF0780277.1 aspartate/glutamate racemase family protein [Granulicatella sp. 19428wC4_WM01]TFU95613.1 glutamate racemase [Granulicatella sp. WM01]
MIGIIAGTPTDTRFGVELVKQITNTYISVAVSPTPQEQTAFQVLSKHEKEKVLQAILQDFKGKGVKQVLIYCNSLSSSVDFDTLSQHLSIPIITPLHFYQSLAKQYTKMGFLAANAQGSAGIERVITRHNPISRVHAISSLDWVEAVETNLPPHQIVETMGLHDTISIFETLQVEVIVFGCTHFPYFLDYYQAKTTLPCLSADYYFLTQLNAI